MCSIAVVLRQTAVRVSFVCLHHSRNLCASKADTGNGQLQCERDCNRVAREEGLHTWTLKRLEGMSLAVASKLAITTLSLLAKASPTCTRDRGRVRVS